MTHSIDDTRGSTDGAAGAAHRRPGCADDAAVEAAGKMSEAFETIEQARGHLFAFHQLTGRADLMLDAAIQQLRDAGHIDLADQVARDLVGRNVLPGRWSFQVVEDYDDGYYLCFQETERLVRSRLVAGRRHVFEAEMKERRRTHGHPAHSAVPAADRKE